MLCKYFRQIIRGRLSGDEEGNELPRSKLRGINSNFDAPIEASFGEFDPLCD